MTVTEVDLTAAAALIVAAGADPVLAHEHRGALAVWQTLIGAPNVAEALRLAEVHAADTTPTIAYVPPL